jgi:hypothetical protein
MILRTLYMSCFYYCYLTLIDLILFSERNLKKIMKENREFWRPKFFIFLVFIRVLAARYKRCVVEIQRSMGQKYSS